MKIKCRGFSCFLSKTHVKTPTFGLKFNLRAHFSQELLQKCQMYCEDKNKDGVGSTILFMAHARFSWRIGMNPVYSLIQERKVQWPNAENPVGTRWDLSALWKMTLGHSVSSSFRTWNSRCNFISIQDGAAHFNTGLTGLAPNNDVTDSDSSSNITRLLNYLFNKFFNTRNVYFSERIFCKLIFEFSCTVELICGPV